MLGTLCTGSVCRRDARKFITTPMRSSAFGTTRAAVPVFSPLPVSAHRSPDIQLTPRARRLGRFLCRERIALTMLGGKFDGKGTGRTTPR